MTGIHDPFAICRQCGDRILWVKTKAGRICQ
nr:MAG TPA_asm: calcium-binding and coiled-coil domain-containing protein [Caudoviricetes sp.]